MLALDRVECKASRQLRAPYARPVAPRPRPCASAPALLLAALLASACAAGAPTPSAPTPSAPTSSGAARPPGTATSPDATPTATATGPAVTLAFAGDVHFEGGSRAALGDGLAAVAPLLSGADLAMVNLETSVTTRGTPSGGKQYVFRAPPSAFTALRRAGVDVVTMANNHGLDYGQVGLADSLAASRAAGLPVVGAGRDEKEAFRAQVTTVHGVRVAFVGATQVLDDNLAATWTAGPDTPGLASAKDEPRLLEAVRNARARADVVVVDLHWGTELARCPTAAQRGLAPLLVAAGADVVVGSHAHVLLGGGWLHGAYVDYGLGNFVFYARTPQTEQSGVLLLTVRGRRVTAARWAPARIRYGLPRPLTGAAARVGLAVKDDLRGCTGLTATPPG